MLRPALVLALCAIATPLTAQRIKNGPWNSPSDIPEGWVVHESRYYHVQSQAGMEKAKRLGKHMDTMLKVYWKLFRPDKTERKKYTIKLLKDREEFLRYGAPPGAGAYYSRTDREMVCYDTGKWMDEEEAAVPITGEGVDKLDFRELNRTYEMDILGAAAHEGWHQYFAWYVGSWVSLPSWINEGMGDYFYTAAPKQVKGRAMPATLGQMNAMRLPIIRVAIQQDRHVPLKDFIYYEQREYYSNPSICYAQGWAFCQFLLHHKDRRLQQLIPVYLRLVRNDTNIQTVTERSFQGLDLDELETEFKAWVLEQKLPHEIEAEKAAKKAAKEAAKAGDGSD